MKLKEIKFTKAKPNYFYAKKSGNELVMVMKPQKGDKVLEIPCISGGLL